MQSIWEAIYTHPRAMLTIYLATTKKLIFFTHIDDYNCIRTPRRNESYINFNFQKYFQNVHNIYDRLTF